MQYGFKNVEMVVGEKHIVPYYFVKGTKAYLDIYSEGQNSSDVNFSVLGSSDVDVSFEVEAKSRLTIPVDSIIQKRNGVIYVKSNNPISVSLREVVSDKVQENIMSQSLSGDISEDLDFNNEEAKYNPLPLRCNGYDDSDKDGLCDFQEKNLGTDPKNNDTDKDGIGDGEEVFWYLSSPLTQYTSTNGLTDKENIESGTLPILIDGNKVVKSKLLNSKETEKANNVVSECDPQDPTYGNFISNNKGWLSLNYLCKSGGLKICFEESSEATKEVWDSYRNVVNHVLKNILDLHNL